MKEVENLIRRADKEGLDGLLIQLAGSVALGPMGTFSLFGKVREDIVNEFESLVSQGALSTQRGVYVAVSDKGKDSYNSIDLIGKDKRKLYFTSRGYAELFRNELRDLYSQKDFNLKLSEERDY